MTDSELIEFASAFREGILDGKPADEMCFMVAAPLAGLETDLSDDPRSEVYEHCWIRLSDGRALDPTADQFGDLPPIYLGPPMWMHGA